MGKKTALFDIEEFNINGEVIRAQEVHEVHEVQKEIGTTQGKKGFKLKRINMAFSDLNHEYVTKESRRRGITATAFVNQIIDEYRNKIIN